MKQEVTNFNSNINYEVHYRNIKNPRLEFKTGRLQVILPFNFKDKNNLLLKHKNWIVKRESIIKRALILSKNKKLKNRSKEEIKKLILKKVTKSGININNVYFKQMKTKWASLSLNKNITFNILMRYLPNSLIEYIIFHELTHVKEKKHNKRFWRFIKSKYPDFENKEKNLLLYWFLIQEKVG